MRLSKMLYTQIGLFKLIILCFCIGVLIRVWFYHSIRIERRFVEHSIVYLHPNSSEFRRSGGLERRLHNFSDKLVSFTLYFMEDGSYANKSLHQARIADLGSFLDAHPNAHLVNIGDRFGEFSILAAVKGRRVVSMPSDEEAVRLVQSSVRVNGVQANVDIVRKPILARWAARRETMNATIAELDDRLSKTGFTETVLRLNVATGYAADLLRFTSLFDQLQVSAILFHWAPIRLSRTPMVADTLFKLGYTPAASLASTVALTGSYRLWPDEVAWKLDREMGNGSQRLVLFNMSAHLGHQFPSTVVPLDNSKALEVFTFEEDMHNASSIQRMEAWETDIFSKIRFYLNWHENVDFIDLGCYIGLYTLQVAALRRQVVAVDPSADNLLRLAKSVAENEFQGRVILVHNAIDANYSSTSTILADHLLRVIPFKRALMRIDMPGRVKEVLRGAHELFAVVSIPLVMMHFSHKFSGAPDDLVFIDKFLTDRGYSPFDSLDSEKPLHRNYPVWPDYLVWRCDF